MDDNPFKDLTPEQRRRVERFAERLFKGIEIRRKLRAKTNEEIAELLMCAGDDMEIESPQAIVIEIAATRLGYEFDEDDPIVPEGFTFNTVTCPDCGKLVKGNWIIRHRRSGCEKG